MIGDTIFAVASPTGASERAVLRISGPAALALASEVLDDDLVPARAGLESSVTVLGHRVPCLVLVMPRPASYTGEDVVELHLPGSPLLLEKVSSLLRNGGRDALPGEFTRRAYENQRLDLAEAEGVLELIHARSEEERRKALEMVEGGVGEAVERVRSLIQDALALLESGLDFTEGETGAVAPHAWISLLAGAANLVGTLQSNLPQARVGGDVLLLGAANAGKSSLCNALAGREEVLVGEAGGTTRDVLRIPLEGDLVLLDAPGDVCGDGPNTEDPNPEDTRQTDAQATALRDSLANSCGAVLVVVDLTEPRVPRSELPVLAVVFTKSDLVPEVPTSLDSSLPAAPRFAVSSLTGRGLEPLRRFLLDQSPGGPTGRGNRIGDLLRASREALDRALGGAEVGEPEEGIAVDVGEALALLDQVHGRSSPEDLLDRVFSRFCLGK